MKPIALITGGTRGIGLGIARCLGAGGYRLALNGVRPEDEVAQVLEELKQEGMEVSYFQGDISKAADRERMLQALKEELGALHVLVNNAGVAPKVRADVLEVTEEDFDYVLDINLKGTFFLTQTVSKWMLEQQEKAAGQEFCIVNITSISAELASVNRAVYCMAKAGLAMFSKVMTMRLAEAGIPVYEVRPGIVATDMTEKVRDVYQKRIEGGLTLSPRMGMPEDIGKAVYMLASGALSYATGQVITVDGGLTLSRL
jgi:3-oxoacyl-[acyl-carrier protein] reductase